MPRTPNATRMACTWRIAPASGEAPAPSAGGREAHSCSPREVAGVGSEPAAGGAYFPKRFSDWYSKKLGSIGMRRSLATLPPGPFMPETVARPCLIASEPWKPKVEPHQLSPGANSAVAKPTVW